MCVCVYSRRVCVYTCRVCVFKSRHRGADVGLCTFVDRTVRASRASNQFRIGRAAEQSTSFSFAYHHHTTPHEIHVEHIRDRSFVIAPSTHSDYDLIARDVHHAAARRRRVRGVRRFGRPRQPGGGDEGGAGGGRAEMQRRLRADPEALRGAGLQAAHGRGRLLPGTVSAGCVITLHLRWR